MAGYLLIYCWIIVDLFGRNIVYLWLILFIYGWILLIYGWIVVDLFGWIVVHLWLEYRLFMAGMLFVYGWIIVYLCLESCLFIYGCIVVDLWLGWCLLMASVVDYRFIVIPSRTKKVALSVNWTLAKCKLIHHYYPLGHDILLLSEPTIRIDSKSREKRHYVYICT